jgi:Zn-dependent metalloprotease
MKRPVLTRLLPLGLLATLVACADAPLTPQAPLDAAPGVQAMDEAGAVEAADTLLASNSKLTAGIDGLVLLETEVDAQGLSHLRYQQVEGRHDVVGGELILHLYPNGTLFRVTDDLVRHLDVDLTPTHGATDAAGVALGLQPDGMVQESDALAELVVVRVDGQDHLAWQVELRQVDARGALSMPVVFVDAHTLKTPWSFDNLKTASLSDSDKVTYDMRNRTNYSRARVGDSSDTELNTTQTAVGQSLSFLSTEMGRDSFDGAGAVVRSYGHYSRNYVNAFWDGQRLTFGDGDGASSNYLGVLDIAAHELGHAVTEYEADLIYSYESGALNEGASDIFAAVVEAHVDGGVTADTWDLGEDCWLSAPALRYMDAPSDDGSSRDHYSNRYTGSSDNGGVHINSGIANHWFYLLSQGGQHHDSAYRSGYAVTGIGITDAHAIWYSALTNYMTSSTDFSGARTATESACTGLGYAAAVCDDVSVAWFEVGVGSDPGGGGGTGGTGGTDGGGTGTDGGGTGTDGGGTGGDSGGTTGGDPVSCPSGWARVDDNLAATGDDDQFAYTTSSNGTHQFELYGPSGADFDLYLHKANKRGRYAQVASATTTSADESLSYSGKAAAYVIQVQSHSGAGDYVLCYDLP